MSFSVRAAILVAAFCAISLAGSGTPGFALELDKSLVITTPSVTDSSVPTIVATPGSVSLVPALPSDSRRTPVNEPVIADDPQNGSRDDAVAPAAQRSFASLAAAVAAQDPPVSVDRDLACLAGTIYFEAKGESLHGQLAVANVVINRTRSGRFPRAICSVVTQRGQFSFVRGGRMPSIASSNPHYRTALAIAQVAMAQHWESPVANALFFHARHVSPGWRLTRVAAIGGHIFYR